MVKFPEVNTVTVAQANICDGVNQKPLFASQYPGNTKTTAPTHIVLRSSIFGSFPFEKKTK